jgi:hypothetical protein
VLYGKWVNGKLETEIDIHTYVDDESEKKNADASRDGTDKKNDNKRSHKNGTDSAATGGIHFYVIAAVTVLLLGVVLWSKQRKLVKK